MTEGKDWQRFGSQIKPDTKKVLDKYAQDYGLEIRQVVDQALKFFFKMSGYSVDGYSVLHQRKAAEDFNTLEDLPAPSPACQELDMYTAFVRGDFADYPEEVNALIKTGAIEKARALILAPEKGKE